MGFGGSGGGLNIGNATDVALNNPSNNQVLTYDSSVSKWKNAAASSGFADPTTTKGDLIVRGASGTTRLPAGTNGYILTADSTQGSGLAWAAAPTVSVSYANLPAGSNISVDYVVGSASYPSRPTARTDIVVIWRGPSQPPNMLNGDEWKVTP